MGQFFTKLIKSIFSPQREFRIIFIGLDNAGKTTILYKLNNGVAPKNSMPTIGFNVESIEINGTKLSAWDIGGQKKLRQLWHHYYQNTDGVVFVVDSQDISRLENEDDPEDSVKHELELITNNDELRNACILILANKQDKPNAMSPFEMTSRLKLQTIFKNRSWSIQAANAIKGSGLVEGLTWLTDEINKKKS